MSKLPKAPLIEVVLELKWEILNKEDINELQYLHGDLYSKLNDKYPFRENILPYDIPLDILANQPVYRFRSSENGYPLVQLGPGIITLNTTDEYYEWGKFSNLSVMLFEKFSQVYSKFNLKKYSPSLLYLDFFPFDFEKNNVYEFINNNFSIVINQSFLENKGNPKQVNFSFDYQLENDDLSVVFQKGINSQGIDGIILQSRINGGLIGADLKLINDWVNSAHETVSEIFKKITEGRLYESFKG
ncbi:TIGR04255 family protein [Flavobacterium sp.]|uniref:TIGR04255 family protein n=1 Tax=Flavobacterium sp. TaxID=239 RepID=UPI00375182D0